MEEKRKGEGWRSRMKGNRSGNGKHFRSEGQCGYRWRWWCGTSAGQQKEKKSLETEFDELKENYSLLSSQSKTVSGAWFCSINLSLSALIDLSLLEFSMNFPSIKHFYFNILLSCHRDTFRLLILFIFFHLFLSVYHVFFSSFFSLPPTFSIFGWHPLN